MRVVERARQAEREAQAPRRSVTLQDIARLKA